MQQIPSLLLFCEIKLPKRQFNNFSDVLPLVEWDFHLKSVKACMAPLSCLSIVTIWLQGLWCSPWITFLFFFYFTHLQLLLLHFTIKFVDFYACVYLFDIYCSSLALWLDLFIPNKIHLPTVTFQWGSTSQNISIRLRRWFLPKSVHGLWSSGL